MRCFLLTPPAPLNSFFLFFFLLLLFLGWDIIAIELFSTQTKNVPPKPPTQVSKCQPKENHHHHRRSSIKKSSFSRDFLFFFLATSRESI